MKKLIVILTSFLFLFSSCSKNDNDTADRAEKEWTNFIQKHLIGQWKPQSIEVKPLVGPVLIEKKYSSIQPVNTQDILVLNQDFTGQFKTFLQQGKLKTIDFTWYHKLEELGIILEDKREFKSLLLEKSSGKLLVSVPLNTVINELKSYIPELENLEAAKREVLFVYFIFVK
ncbi:hypothetical protein [Myroides fluvii]|uniref:hypothetical protein n=1 Tax=Myroides fluvii TaxID=2572594 RepID=UPI00131B95F5|nr:hypothetical protein [Myroides fluvii]